MGPESGGSDSALESLPNDTSATEREPVDVKFFFDAPCTFSFFQAVRLLERRDPNRKPVGRFARPSEEAVRFEGNATLDFPASEIHRVTEPEGEPPKLMVNFMGAYGPQGELPRVFTTLIADRLRSRDHTLKDFIDIFNHRMISLFYQAWEKYRFPIAYERGETDRVAKHVMDLVGIGTPGLHDRTSVSDLALVYYGGLLAQKPHSADALRGLLMDYFGVPVEIQQFTGSWYSIDRKTQTWLEGGETVSEMLGFGAIVGDEVWDQQSGARVKLGPLTLEQYLEFLPFGKAHKQLKDLVRFYAGTEIDFEAQLILRRGAVPRCELGAGGEAGPMLGWVTWSSTKLMDRDPGDTILRL